MRISQANPNLNVAKKLPAFASNNRSTTPNFSATAVVNPSPKQYISSPELPFLVPVSAQLFP
jgi:hypothetical protein